MIDLPFRPDRSAHEPVYRQLAAHVRGLVETGRLAPGTKLPASRELARSLGVGRITVVLAYHELVRTGLATSRVGQGTFVAMPEGRVASDGARRERSFVWSSLFAMRARLLELPAALAGAATMRAPRHDFRGGQVDEASLPLDETRIALASAIRRFGGKLALHGDPFGWPALREEIVRLLLTRGIRCELDEVLVTSGAQQVVDLVARVLLDPGDTVVLEQPGYFGAAMAFRAAQANVVGVGVDGEGLRTDDLARVLRARRVKLVYATPAAQSPTGVVMGEARRREFLELADTHQTPILEDDYAAELRYRSPAVSALKAADEAGQVVYAGTFAKTLFPNLRLGFVVAPRPLLRKMVLARWNADGGGSLLPQIALTTLIRSGAVERHVRRLRKIYAERLDTLRSSLAATMPPGTTWSDPAAGHGVWVTLPPGTDAEGVAHDAAAGGIAYVRGTAFYVDGQGADQISLSFSTLTPREITRGVEALAAIVRRRLPSGKRGTPARARGGRDGRIRQGTDRSRQRADRERDLDVARAGRLV